MPRYAVGRRGPGGFGSAFGALLWSGPAWALSSSLASVIAALPAVFAPPAILTTAVVAPLAGPASAIIRTARPLPLLGALALLALLLPRGSLPFAAA